MKYADMFARVKGMFIQADVSDITEHLAYQFNITGEAEGIFYVEVKEEKAYVEPKEWTIITALDRVLDRARGSELSDEFWSSAKNPLAYLRERLELRNLSCHFVSWLVLRTSAVTPYLGWR